MKQLALALVFLFPLLAHADDKKDPGEAAKEVEKAHEKWLGRRAARKILTLKEFPDDQTGKRKDRTKAYIFNERRLSRVLWDFLPPVVKDKVKRKDLNSLLAKRGTWASEPLCVESSKIRRVVVHRDQVSVYWSGKFVRPSRFAEADDRADFRMEKARVDGTLFSSNGGRDEDSLLTTWVKLGGKWCLGAVARPKKETPILAAMIQGELLRDPHGISPPENSYSLSLALEAEDDMRKDVKDAGRNSLAADKAKEEALKALEERHVWDVGILGSVGKGLGEIRCRVHVGHVTIYVTDPGKNREKHYASLKPGSLVQFSGIYERDFSEMRIVGKASEKTPAVVLVPE